tara:strand:- start:60 stop:248 length:189 start_codon:yes stop_codon:yes gene_type:complete
MLCREAAAAMAGGEVSKRARRKVHQGNGEGDLSDGGWLGRIEILGESGSRDDGVEEGDRELR